MNNTPLNILIKGTLHIAIKDIIKEKKDPKVIQLMSCHVYGHLFTLTCV